MRAGSPAILLAGTFGFEMVVEQRATSETVIPASHVVRFSAIILWVGIFCQEVALEKTGIMLPASEPAAPAA